VIGGGRIADARRCSGLTNGPELDLAVVLAQIRRVELTRDNDISSSEKMHRYKSNENTRGYASIMLRHTIVSFRVNQYLDTLSSSYIVPIR